jgi:hypothetical protein
VTGSESKFLSRAAGLHLYGDSPSNFLSSFLSIHTQPGLIKKIKILLLAWLMNRKKKEIGQVHP